MEFIKSNNRRNHLKRLASDVRCPLSHIPPFHESLAYLHVLLLIDFKTILQLFYDVLIIIIRHFSYQCYYLPQWCDLRGLVIFSTCPVMPVSKAIRFGSVSSASPSSLFLLSDEFVGFSSVDFS